MVGAEDELECISYLLLHNTLSQIDQLKTMHICYLIVPWIRSLGTGWLGFLSRVSPSCNQVSAGALLVGRVTFLAILDVRLSS